MIERLTEYTIDKIAAGEVVERPLSVVKELIENSIDAEATEIIVEIKKGGKSYIRVTDNGKGINQKEILHALKRHYTSKLKEIDDLDSLGTLGFRGEALASISSVSKLEITTKEENDNYGINILYKNNEIASQKEVACITGTSIIARDLFYNLPVRKKFLASDISEGNRITNLITKVALVNKDITFKYIRDKKIVFNTPRNTSLKNKITILYGEDFSNSLIYIDKSIEDYSFKGYITDLNYFRGNRNHQMVFVNDRYIKSDEMSKIIEENYKTIIPSNKFPGFILYIYLNPKHIDVNIHPQKYEIKFKDFKKIEELLNNGLNDIFTGNIQTKKFKNDMKKESFLDDKVQSKNTLDYNFKDNIIDYKEDNIQANVEDNIEANENLDKQYLEDNKHIEDSRYSKESRENKNIFFETNFNSKEYNNFNNKDLNSEKNINVDIDLKSKEYNNNNTLDFKKNGSGNIDFSTNTIDLSSKNTLNINELHYIGYIFDTYLLFQNHKNRILYIIDQHAAHERINFEKYLKKYNSKKINMQESLIPIEVSLSNHEYTRALENIELFLEFGLAIENFGSNTIIIRAIPAFLTNTDSKRLFYSLLEGLDDFDKSSMEIEKLIKKACTDSVKAGDILNKKEITNLLFELFKCKVPYTCPHGRPIIVEMKENDFKKMFNRIQN